MCENTCVVMKSAYNLLFDDLSMLHFLSLRS